MQYAIEFVYGKWGPVFRWSSTAIQNAFFFLLQQTSAEPEITVYDFPDKVSDQMLKHSDILKYGWLIVY